MVSISCVKSKRGYEEFTFKGHAGFDRVGRDVVCSAVSILFINTFNSIEKFTGDKLSTLQEKDFIKVTFPDPLSDKSKLLLDSMMLGLVEVSKNYGGNISLTIKEV